MNLYLDASALVKRYVSEPGSAMVHEIMAEAQTWFMCRTGFLETLRAVTIAAGPTTARKVREEWASFAVVEVDQDLVDRAGTLALRRDLRSLDSLHLASALLLPREDLIFSSWDRHLRVAAEAEGLAVHPDALP
ncbi:MAG: type II toxin-antitoxin system VapC family toxin [Acidimicrobiales bacterium]